MSGSTLLQHTVVMAVRRSLGELAIGLALAWWLLSLLELVRATLVSTYLNLNLLLGIAALLWLAGSRGEPSPRRPYGTAVASAILVGTAGYVLAAGSPYRTMLAGLAFLTTLGLVLLAHEPDEGYVNSRH